VTRDELTRFVRTRLDGLLLDETGESRASSHAIYTLSDPREVRAARYVGQTRAPRRRWLQHVREARLWLPAERPWWVADQRLRPLYAWIRELYEDEQRLPVMLVTAWVGDRADATLAERELIQRYLREQVPLLNVATSALEPQLRLL
jgi:hypothetical protein